MNTNNSQGKYPEADRNALENFVETQNVDGVIAVATAKVFKNTGKNPDLNPDDLKTLQNLARVWLKSGQVIEPRNMAVYNYFTNPKDAVAITGALAEAINDVRLEKANRGVKKRVDDIF